MQFLCIIYMFSFFTENKKRPKRAKNTFGYLDSCYRSKNFDSCTKKMPINIAMQMSSLPPALLPLIATFSFWNAFSGRLNKNPKKLNWSMSMDRVLFLPMSIHKLSSTAKIRSSRSMMFMTLTYANFRVCVVSTPIRSTPGSHTKLQCSTESRHSLYTCSASNPRLRSTIMCTGLIANSEKHMRTASICDFKSSNVL